MPPARRSGERAEYASGGQSAEARLDALREEASRTGRVTAPGARVAGGPIPEIGYYGRPIVKPAVWTWEIPLYFFVGGMAGMSAVVAAAARLAESDLDLVRAALWLGVAGAVASPVLLILDLGRPTRFLHMLRVFKWRSPMSMGAWILLAFGAAVTAAAALFEGTCRSAPGTAAYGAGLLLSGALWAAAVSGALLATYTGVLIGATATPAWHTHHRSLPLHFGVAGLGSAAAALILLHGPERSLVALGVAAAAIETLFGAWIELSRNGAADRALRHGWSGWTLRIAGLLAGPVALALWFAAPPWCGAIAFLAGALVSRYGWIAAGRASGRDPAAALSPQTD
ncbi:MAG: NrfD/PsrC family molybdoenzyme membrane anchor subunit [Gemmatimonadota bacterium]